MLLGDGMKENSSNGHSVRDLVAKDKLSALVSSAQEHEDNRKRLDEVFGSTKGLAKGLRVDLHFGLATDQVEGLKEAYGPNSFPEIPMKSFCTLFVESFNDTILLVLIAAAVVSLIIGIIEDPAAGWIDGVAILIAVLIVALVTASNDYSKELQFRALEKTSEETNQTMVLRDGTTQLIHPEELVVGDVVVMKPGDGIPADGLLFAGEGVKSNESGLTGEPDDLTKKAEVDCFLYSSCTLTEVSQSADCKMLIHAVGEQSQWGKIRATLVSEPSETPLQLKLNHMAKLIGYVGVAFAVLTFVALIVMIWAKHDGEEVTQHVVEAFIIAVTIIVVAIPEGLPLAVTISLAYSTRKMYKDKNLIRVLAACETMGNATNICSDKTGTLTENQMTVVEGWLSDKIVMSDGIKDGGNLSAVARDVISQNIAINRSCDVHFKDEEGHDLHKPNVIGSATEGALVILAAEWGYNATTVKETYFSSERDHEYPFNSAKKRSSVLITQANGTLRLYSKGASENILADCTRYSNQAGEVLEMTPEKRAEMEALILTMAKGALRTLCLAHIDYASEAELEEGYELQGPDADNMILDAIVGIMDPLRDDVKDAVATAQSAGVMVRMVTGDNINTAKAIATKCGIYDPEYGVALEGPVFRAMSPAQLDEVLPRLQVLARSSPNDKYLLVTRLNGHGIPDGEKEWLELHDKDGELGLSWDAHKDLLLPGYKEEWKRKNKSGQVVGVTGDGTNDAPALKAADVGLSMGITGTKVAQNASDIVILDDKFSSIVRAIMWGRGVYDNIRKFLQFQLTVNVVALLIVFIGALSGKDPPLNPLMMLWVNLIMDTMGALALGTEAPTLELLDRRPYRRDAPLISRPMGRNILVQSIFQLILLLWLLYDIHTLFPGVQEDNACKEWSIDENHVTEVGGHFCTEYRTYIDETCTLGKEYECYDEFFESPDLAFDEEGASKFQDDCLECESEDYTHYSILFNVFVFCQIFNEFNARSIFDEWNAFKGISKNPLFFAIILITTGLQVLIVEMGAEFTKTAHLSTKEWLISVALGFIALPLGILMRFIPVEEDPKSFCGYATPATQRLLSASVTGANRA